MKTIKVVALTVVLIMVFVTIGQTKENQVARAKAVTELNQNLKDLFKEMPFDEIMCYEKNCTLSLCFKVNDEGIVEFEHVQSKNDKLVHYSKQLFESNELIAEQDIFGDEYYWIKMKFQYRD